jgi:nicotinamidase/pyrazinamidase
MRVASKDAHSPNAVWVATEENPQFSPVGLLNSDIRWNRHCEVGTPGFEFLPGLPHPSEYAFIAYKGLERDTHPYGACYHDLLNTRSTGIIEFMKIRDIRTVIVGGLALDYCVKTTALQLRAARFNVIVNLASTRAIGDPTAAIQELRDHEVWIVENSGFITDINSVGIRDDFE